MAKTRNITISGKDSVSGGRSTAGLQLEKKHRVDFIS